MEIEDGSPDGGAARPPRSRCYSILLFLLDLALVTFLVPRGTRMSVRLVALLALRGLLTTLATATNVGIYQALLYNAGRTTEPTQLASGINALFGITPDTCTRSKRDTWTDLLNNLDRKPEFPSLQPPKKKSKEKTKLSHYLKMHLDSNTSRPTSSSTTPMPDLTTILSTTSPFTSTPMPSTIYSPVTSVPEDLNALMIESSSPVETVLSTETCLNSLHVLATLVLFALTATMNVILLGCLLRKVLQLRAKEEQLRGSFDALQRLYSAGRLLENVNLE